ncbi:MAG TPA: molybdate ABC transporter substrate-binding protein [Terriglobia bacterium]|nr:molybdate ABC transporter substrate-binding protein [Terriglobia bacterium]
MKTHRLLCTAAVVTLLVLGQGNVANAAEIRVLCSNGFKAVLEELAPQFERASGHKLVVTYGLAAGFKQQIDSGTPFDVAILTPALVDELIKSGKMAADSRSVIARTGLGIMIKAGARKPDVRTTDSFKKSLLDASSIAFAKEGASGVAFVATIEKLGMTSTLQPKLKPTASGEAVNDLVVQGGAQYGILPLSEILAVKGAELGGMFPAEVQTYITMATAVSSSAKQAAAGRDLVKFLMAPAANGVIKTKGMERN